jgi:hypothetical protein
MSTVLANSQLPLDDFRTSQKSQHASQDAHMITRGLAELAGGLQPPDPLDPVAGVAAATVVRATGAGTVAQGAIFASFLNAGAANATVLGITVKPGESLRFPTAYGLVLPAMAYNATATELLINTVSA